MTWKRALKKSIDEKWDTMAFGYTTKSIDCELCDKNPGGFFGCIGGGCPVALCADAVNCMNTPFRDEWIPAWEKHSKNAMHPDVQDAAVLEYLFLCMIYHEYYG
jgi:hypothetical protein